MYEQLYLARFHTCVTGRNVDVSRSNGASTGGGSNFLGEDDLASFIEIGIGELFSLAMSLD